MAVSVAESHSSATCRVAGELGFDDPGRAFVWLGSRERWGPHDYDCISDYSGVSGRPRAWARRYEHRGYANIGTVHAAAFFAGAPYLTESRATLVGLDGRHGLL